MVITSGNTVPRSLDRSVRGWTSSPRSPIIPAVLTEISSLTACLARWCGRSLPRRVKAHWLAQAAAPEAPQPRWFTDDESAPRVVMRLHGTGCTVHGPPEAVAEALVDLRAGRFSGAAHWPGLDARVAWDKAGQRELHLSRVDPSTLEAAYRAGFRPAPEARQPYYCAHAWCVTGRPRFGAHVVHPVRIVYGTELLELFHGAVEPEEQSYIRACLEAGPSCVVEAGGRPVSWSLTHLGGAVGAIYTRPEARGHGYGKSLTALHVDTLLGLRGIAAASVRVDNAASYRMFQALGAKHIRGPMTWSNLLW